MFFITQIPVICLVFVPTLHENMYISYNIMILTVHFSAFRYLYASTETPNNPQKNTNPKIPPSNQPLNLDNSQHDRSRGHSRGGDGDGNKESSRGANPSIPFFNPFTTNPSIHTNTTHTTVNSNSNSNPQLDILLDNRGSNTALDLDLTGRLDHSNHSRSGLDAMLPQVDTVGEQDEKIEETNSRDTTGESNTS